MTPFDTWYSTNIAPTLPTDAPPAVLKLSREMMAACWNAALTAIQQGAGDIVGGTVYDQRRGQTVRVYIPRRIESNYRQIQGTSHQAAGDPMTFDDYWQSRECEIAAEQSLEKGMLSILAANAWNAALDEAANHSYPMAQLIAARAVAIDELEDLKVKIS
jgi:hypothetical protein